jgi:2'-5' RNA ligase
MDSSIDILLHELDDLIGPWWRQTPASADGMPPHITLLWPWKPLTAICEEDFAIVETIAAATPAARVELTEINSFPGVLWLRPEPADSLLALMRNLWAAFPDYPPFGGTLANEPVAHVTVAKAPDGDLDALAQEILQHIGPHLPLEVWIREVTVSVEGASPDGRWAPVRRFPLVAS